MRAYTELLAATCHRRGAHAMGGMAALIPSRKDPEANERALDGVRGDKEREVSQGYDGTWVAHPDLVPVAREVFERGLDGAPNQLERRRDDVAVTAEQLQDLAATPGRVTEAGPAHERQRRLPVRLVLADRPRRRGDQLADGGRGHRRDLPHPDLAVGPARRRARGRAHGHARARAADPRRGDRQDPRAGGGGDVDRGAAGRDARDLRPRRPVAGADRVPDAARLRSTSTDERDRRTQPRGAGGARARARRGTTRRCCSRAPGTAPASCSSARGVSAPGSRSSGSAREIAWS